MEVPLALDFGQARASVGSGGSLVNLFAQAAPVGAKSEVVLIGAPGARPWVQLQYLNDVPALTNDTDVHAMLFAFGKIVVVTAHAIYLVSQDGSWTRRHNTGMAAPVIMAFNRIDVAAVNGTAAFWVNEAAATAITGANFYPSQSVTFLDSYFIFNRAGTGQVFNTAPYSRTFDGLDIADAEKAPDNTVGVLAAGDDLFIFGADTTEVWYNAAQQQFPFLRTPGAVIEHGCAAIATARQFDSTVFWLSSGGLVLMAAGLRPSRISDDQVEAALKERRADWASAHAFVYSDEGHTFYQITAGDLTLTYDVATGFWHQRSNYSRGHALGRCHVQAWGRHYIGDDQGRILEMSPDTFDDAGEPLISEVVSMPYHNGRMFSAIGEFELQMDTGLSALGEEYQVRLAASGDGGRTWGSDMPASIGRTGDYLRRVLWRKLGARRDHRFRLRISDPFRRAILATAYLRAG